MGPEYSCLISSFLTLIDIEPLPCSLTCKFDLCYVENSYRNAQTLFNSAYDHCEKNGDKKPGAMKLQERAIWMAVLCLSPVNIQKFIPAFLSVSIVSGTPSYKITVN